VFLGGQGEQEQPQGVDRPAHAETGSVVDIRRRTYSFREPVPVLSGFLESFRRAGPSSRMQVVVSPQEGRLEPI
jgi:hypothetical protein